MPVVDLSANHHWSIRLLGGFGLSGPEGRVEVPPAGQRLVAYLAIQGHPVRRSTVAAAIWPDVDETRARANLRSTVCRLGALAPVVDATAASLTIGPDVIVDVDDLQEQVRAARAGTEHPSAARPGFDLELLPGWEEDIGDVRDEADLPQATRDYLAFVADFLNVPIALISVGPGRDQVIWTETGRASAIFGRGAAVG